MQYAPPTPSPMRMDGGPWAPQHSSCPVRSPSAVSKSGLRSLLRVGGRFLGCVCREEPAAGFLRRHGLSQCGEGPSVASLVGCKLKQAGHTNERHSSTNPSQRIRLAVFLQNQPGTQQPQHPHTVHACSCVTQQLHQVVINIYLLFTIPHPFLCNAARLQRLLNPRCSIRLCKGRGGTSPAAAAPAPPAHAPALSSPILCNELIEQHPLDLLQLRGSTAHKR